MALKIHLRANKLTEEHPYAYSRCASRPPVNGRVRRNVRQTYASIPQSHIVGFKEFMTTTPADRCSHCCDTGLMAYNIQRRARGLDRVTTLPFAELKTEEPA